MHDFILADEDWIGLMIFKYLRTRTGSDSILSDRTGLELKNYTVRSSLGRTQKCPVLPPQQLHTVFSL